MEKLPKEKGNQRTIYRVTKRDRAGDILGYIFLREKNLAEGIKEDWDNNGYMAEVTPITFKLNLKDVLGMLNFYGKGNLKSLI